MLRRIFGALVVLAFCLGITLAAEIRAVITKVDGDKVTFNEMKGKGKDAEKGDEKTLTAVSNVKVVKAKYNKDTQSVETGEALDGGLKNEMFSKIGEKGVRGTIITNDDNKITEIRVMGRRGKKNQ